MVEHIPKRKYDVTALLTHMKIQSDLHAKSTLIKCNFLINVVFNNTVDNNVNK